jgi:hypothetical protein
MNSEAIACPANNVTSSPVTTTTTHSVTGTAIPQQRRTRQQAVLTWQAAPRRVSATGVSRPQWRDMLACWQGATAAASGSTKHSDPTPLLGPNGHVLWTFDRR